MTSSPLGPIPPSHPPIGPAGPGGMGTPAHRLAQITREYASLLLNTHPFDLDELENTAQKTVDLNLLAQKVITTTSPILRTAAESVERLLQTPISVTGTDQDVSLFKAAADYLNNAKNAWPPLIDSLHQNPLALELLCKELTLATEGI